MPTTITNDQVMQAARLLAMASPSSPPNAGWGWMMASMAGPRSNNPRRPLQPGGGMNLSGFAPGLLQFFPPRG